MLHPFEPIGVIRSPFADTGQIPKGPGARHDAEGVLELRPDLEPGLLDIDGFSHLYVLWVFDRADGSDLMAHPPIDDRPHGVFATRSPRRPNPIGLSVVRLLRCEGPRLHVRGVDMLDGSPVLDIKPYLSSVPAEEIRRGWLAEAEARGIRATPVGGDGAGAGRSAPERPAAARTFTPYAPRPVRPLGVGTRAGHRLKRYAITYRGAFEESRFAAGLALADAALPAPDRGAGRPGLGFLILHQGDGSDYLVLGWWDRENELPLRVFVRPHDERAWREARGGESVCVWDLDVLWHEREAYVATLLAGGTEADYLARWLERSAPA